MGKGFLTYCSSLRLAGVSLLFLVFDEIGYLAVEQLAKLIDGFEVDARSDFSCCCLV
jgi:hypothetical protein